MHNACSGSNALLKPELNAKMNAPEGLKGKLTTAKVVFRPLPTSLSNVGLKLPTTKVVGL